ncbi:MAG: DUF1501 domain-containing protein [Sphingomonadales bacterium]|nr:DUF1501 domain-containing protein [Sphingomonadales bacterium]
MLDRRQILIGGGLLGAATFAPQLAFARTASARRLVYIIQRGAADGLATLAPTGDPAFTGLRGDLADYSGGARLDSLFTLHPALAQVAQLYAGKQALFAHAVASPYRDRSHFDGQNVLETGGLRPYERKDGWINRLLGLLSGSPVRALALAPTVPTALRGSVEVSSYAPSALPDTSEDLRQRVSDLYQSDAQLHGLWEQAQATRAMVGAEALTGGRGGAAAGRLIASLMAGANGAGVVMVETNGWDTHSGQKARMSAQLGGLDALVGALRDGLGPMWNDTLVIVATEFGRTAAINGTGGTDHGTASLAMLLGGAIAGGRTIADWPGISSAQLYEGRDLRPTLSMETLVGSAVAAHFGLDPADAIPRLFAEAAGKPLAGLIRS